MEGSLAMQAHTTYRAVQNRKFQQYIWRIRLLKKANFSIPQHPAEAFRGDTPSAKCDGCFTRVTKCVRQLGFYDPVIQDWVQLSQIA